MKWISCNDKTPAIDAVVRRVGYTDTMTTGNYKDNLKKRLINAIDYEWLDESPSGANVLVEALREIASLYNTPVKDVLSPTDMVIKMGEIAQIALSQYNAVEPEPWKSVEKDGYPEHNRGLIVCIPGEDYHITSGMWDRDNKWVLLDDYRVPDCPVTHYMLLPKLPKEFEKEVSENDAVMEHLAKLLKMGKIKKPETFPSQSPQTPIDTEPEEELWDCVWIDWQFSGYAQWREKMQSKFHITRK